MDSPQDGQILRGDELKHLHSQIAELIRQQREVHERRRLAQRDKDALQEQMDAMVREMEMKLSFWYAERQDLQDQLHALKKHTYKLVERSKDMEESVHKEMKKNRDAWVEEHKGLKTNVARLKEEKYEVELKERQALREQENLQAIVNMNMSEVEMNLKFHQEERQLLLKEITMLMHEKYEAEQNVALALKENDDLADEINRMGLKPKPKKASMQDEQRQKVQRQKAALVEQKTMVEERMRQAVSINKTLQREKDELKETIRHNKLALKDLVEKLEVGYLREMALRDQLQEAARRRFSRRAFTQQWARHRAKR